MLPSQRVADPACQLNWDEYARAQPQLVTSLPSGAVKGRQVLFNTGSGSPWLLTYNGVRWTVTGEPALRDYAAATESTVANGPVDLTTDGPKITIPLTGDYSVDYGASTYLSAIVGGAQTTFIYLSRAGTVVDQMQNNIPGPNLIFYPATTTPTLSFTAGQVVKLRYGSLGGSTAVFAKRWLRITPLLIG